MASSGAMPIEPMRSLEGIERKRKSVTNPDHLHMLDVLQEHVEAELAGDLERIMKTLVPEPAYHFWGAGAGFHHHFVGQAETRAFYTLLFDSGSNQLERTYDRFIIDDYGLFGDGVIKIILQGKALPNIGVEGLDPNGRYLSIMQSAVIIPFTDGLMAGEDTYADARRELIKLDD